MSIRIITDSASDISIEEAKILGVTVIPMEVNIDGKFYEDGKDMTNDDFYKILPTLKNLPKTSQLTPMKFELYFDEVKNEGNKAIVILVSSKLSGTFQNAKLLSQEYNDIYVLDSKNVAIGERILVLLAVKLVKEGKSFEEIISILEDEKNRITFIAKLDTLKYLRKGGRISALVAFAGEALNIKPIVGIVNGEVSLLGKGRGLLHANEVITKLVHKYGDIDVNMPFGTTYSGTSNDMLKKYINLSKNELDINEEPKMYQLGCTIGTHIGPDAIGLAFFKKNLK